jgi:hypothetical protein
MDALTLTLEAVENAKGFAAGMRAAYTWLYSIITTEPRKEQPSYLLLEDECRNEQMLAIASREITI